MNAPESRVDWLYASGAISREEWIRIRPLTSLEVLNARYARGEITLDEYLRIQADITGVPPRGSDRR